MYLLIYEDRTARISPNYSDTWLKLIENRVLIVLVIDQDKYFIMNSVGDWEPLEGE